jgi:hypothetical protein
LISLEVNLECVARRLRPGPLPPDRKCPECGGSGVFEKDPSGAFSLPCPACNGEADTGEPPPGTSLEFRNSVSFFGGPEIPVKSVTYHPDAGPLGLRLRPEGFEG